MMDLRVTGYLHPLKEFPEKGTHTTMLDDMEAKIEYINTIQSMNEVHDEIQALSVGHVALERIATLNLSKYNSVLRAATEAFTPVVTVDDLRNRFNRLMVNSAVWANQVSQEELALFKDKANSAQAKLDAFLV